MEVPSNVRVLMFILAGEFLTVDAAIRTMEQRKVVNECAEATASMMEYFDSNLQFESSIPSLQVTNAEQALGSTSTWSASIAYGPNFKVLSSSMAKEQYILTQCGTTQPTTSEINAVAPLPSSDYNRKFFTIPLQTIVATGSTEMGMIQDLGLADRVSGIPSTVVGACWQKAQGCNAETVDPYGNATVYQNLLAAAEASLMSCASTTPVDCSNVHAQATGIHFGATTSGGALQNAEYVKFIAAFFNKEAEAAFLFDTVMSNWQSSANSAISNPRPVVAFIDHASWSNSLILSMAQYKLDIVTGAGGANVDASLIQSQIGSNMVESDAVFGNPAAGKSYTLSLANYASLAEASAAFFGAAAWANVDAVVDETYGGWGVPVADYTIDTFYTNWNLSASSQLPFIANSKVFRTDGVVSPTGSLDWFESRVARPDWAVQGLRRVLAPDAIDQFAKKYFRNIAIGEMPTEIAESECTDVLPVCDTSEFARALPMITPDVASAHGWGMRGALLATLAVSSLFSV